MLVLQAVLGSLMLGAAAGSPTLDSYGNPLCITSVDTSTEVDGGRDHGARPDCCGSMCGMAAPLIAEDRTPHSLANPLAFALQVEFALEEVAHLPATDRNQGNPRAPPATF